MIDPSTSFHATVSSLNQPNTHDRIAFLSNFHTNCNLLSSFNKKLYILEFLSLVEVPGGSGR